MTDPVWVTTLMPPWSWAVVHAGKDVENRTWRPLTPFRMLVHAGKTHDDEGDDFLAGLGIEVPDTMYYGAIIGSVLVTGYEKNSTSPWAVKGFWHWKLARPVAARTPLSWRGRPGLFPPPDNWRDAFSGRRKG